MEDEQPCPSFRAPVQREQQDPAEAGGTGLLDRWAAL